MTSLVNVDEELNKNKSKRLKAALLYACALTAILLAVVLIFIFSTNNYLWNLLVDIALLIVLIGGSVYFFSVIYNDVSNRAKYFEKIKSGLKETFIIEFEKNIAGVISQDKLEFYAIQATVVDGLEKTSKIFIEYNEPYAFEKDMTYEITCCGRLILSVVRKK